MEHCPFTASTHNSVCTMFICSFRVHAMTNQHHTNIEVARESTCRKLRSDDPLCIFHRHVPNLRFRRSATTSHNARGTEAEKAITALRHSTRHGIAVEKQRQQATRGTEAEKAVTALLHSSRHGIAVEKPRKQATTNLGHAELAKRSITAECA